MAGLLLAPPILLGQDEGSLLQQALNAARAGNYDTAIADFTQIIQLDPNFAIAYGARGDAYLAKRDYDKAIADFGQAILLAPKDKLAYRERAHAYADKGDYDKAILDFSQFIQLDPKNAKAYAWRGYTYLKKGDNDKAIADINQAIQIDPANSATYTQSGKAYGWLADNSAKAGDFDNAVKWQSKYLETPNLSASDNAEGKTHLALYQAHKSYPAVSPANSSVNPPTPAPVEKEVGTK